MSRQHRYIGYRIARYRSHRRMSQQNLADAAGVTHEYISMLENGKRSPGRYSTLCRLAHGLGIDITALTTVTPGATLPEHPELSTILTLDLRDIEASVEYRDDCEDRSLDLIITDGVTRIELTGGPADEPRLTRNAATGLAKAVQNYLLGRVTTSKQQ
jgi:transcriptional regulator with XRE-family HTH domain